MREHETDKMKDQKIKELPESERPYEKCLMEGPESLSDRELLAVIMRTGMPGMNSLSLAGNVLEAMQNTAYPGLHGILHSSIADLKEIRGIGNVKAIQLKCIGELSRRIAVTAARPELDFNNPQSIAAYYMERLRHQEQEVMLSMMLDNRNHLLGDKVLSMGTVNSTLITPREVYLEAVRYHAVSLILIHNHPSGDPTPSIADREVTKRIHAAGEMLGISLLDHIVIGDQSYVSFREEGWIEEA